MDYVFNTEKETASEIHGILGFVDADFTMVQLLPYLRKATKELIKYIGEDNYNKALDSYNDNDVDDEFLVLVRYAIAINAFREFAPLSDVSYTTSGRIFRFDEHTRAATETEKNVSDASMEYSYYSVLNEIFDFIIDSDDLEESPLIEKTKGLFVSSIETFEEYVKINGSYALFFNLIPSLKLAEKRLIKPRILDHDFKDNEDVLRIIQNICVDFAMIDGMRKNSVRLFPHGVLKESTGNSKQSAAKQFDIEASILHYKDELEALLVDLETEVQKLNTTEVETGEMINFKEDDGFVTM